MKAVWTPFPERDLRKEEYTNRTYAYPIDLAARPIDPRLMPFAIITNATMVPTLVQNLSKYCRSRSPVDFETEPAIRRVDLALKRLETSYVLGDSFTSIFLFALYDLFSSLKIPIETYSYPAESLGVQFSSRLVKELEDGSVLPDSSTLLAVDGLREMKIIDSYRGAPSSDETDFLNISDVLDKICLMAESRRVCDPEDFKFTCIRKEDSFVIRVRQLRFPVLAIR
jgi:hypothetical protein